MANFRDYDYNQTMMVPVCLEDQLQPGTLEFTIHHLVESYIDMSVFEQRYKNDDTGRPAYDPKILLKVVLMGYSRGLNTSRKIEAACRENIIFLSLSCGQVPDYSTIATFISSMAKEALQIFQDILMVCAQQGLLGGTCFALDGCKLPSNASKDLSGTIKELEKKKKRIKAKLTKLMRKHQRADARDQHAEQLQSEKQKREIKIKELERTVNKLQSWLNQAKPKVGKKNQELKSNITDNDSAQMVTSHGTIQGYNAQALVDSKHQIIIHTKAIGNGNDSEILPQMIEGATANMKAIGKSDDYFRDKQLLADAAYHSETNLKACAVEGLDAYIPNLSFRTIDPRMVPLEQLTKEHLLKKFSLADFVIDCNNKICKCPAGYRLTYHGKLRKGQTYYFKFVADKGQCLSCRLRPRCIQSEKTKGRHVYVYVDPQVREMSLEIVKKFDQESHRDIYDKRIVIVEPVFANIREQKRLNRFTLRGEEKIDIQWRLYGMIHNIEKIAKYASNFAFCST